MAAIDAEAQYAITMGTSIGAPTNLYSVTFHFEYAFVGLEVSVAVLAMYFVIVILKKYASTIVVKVGVPEMMAFLWAGICVCMVIVWYLTFKLIVVAYVYLQYDSRPKGGIIILFIIMNVAVSTYTAIKTLPLYSHIDVPNTWQGILNILTVGLCRRKVIKFAIFLTLPCMLFCTTHFSPLGSHCICFSSRSNAKWFFCVLYFQYDTWIYMFRCHAISSRSPSHFRF